MSPEPTSVEQPRTTDPLWLQLRNHPSLFCLHITPSQAQVLLSELADRIEHRGHIDYDRDPGETADWLRAEAAIAEQHAAERLAHEQRLASPPAARSNS